MNPEPKPRTPWSYAASKREAEAWANFAEQHFPAYEQFWHLYVEPRTRRAWHLAFLSEVPTVERRVARLHTLLINKLYNLDKRSREEPTNKRQVRLRLGELRVLAHTCDDVELFLFLLLFATGELPEIHPVYKGYVARREAHKAAVEAANAPFKGRLLSLDDIPAHIPFEDILPEESVVATDYYGLEVFTPLVAQIRRDKEIINKLPSLGSKHYLPTYDIMTPKEVVAEIEAGKAAEIVADTPAVQKLIAGYPSASEFIASLIANLTAEINQIWADQVIPLAQKHAQIPQTELIKSV